MAKCPICDGKGYVYNALGDFNEDCVYCQRKGKVRVEGEPMTEQEYIQTCNTEQLAEVLGNIAKNAYQCGQNGKTNKCVNRNHCTGYCDYEWEMWLKQPHAIEVEK